MSGASRAKGLRGEREVAGVFEEADWHTRGLESGGDMLVHRLLPARAYLAAELHLEIKRQETLRLPLWLRQAKAEAPPGVVPVVVFRQSRAEWLAALPLADLLRLLG